MHGTIQERRNYNSISTWCRNICHSLPSHCASTGRVMTLCMSVRPSLLQTLLANLRLVVLSKILHRNSTQQLLAAIGERTPRTDSQLVFTYNVAPLDYHASLDLIFFLPLQYQLTASAPRLFPLSAEEYCRKRGFINIYVLNIYC